MVSRTMIQLWQKEHEPHSNTPGKIRSLGVQRKKNKAIKKKKKRAKKQLNYRYTNTGFFDPECQHDTAAFDKLHVHEMY